MKKIIKLPNYDLISENITYFSCQYDDLYSELISQKDLSYFKLSCYCNKIKNIQDGLKSNMEEKEIVDQKILITSAVVFIISILMLVVSAFTLNLPVFITLATLGVNMVICKKMLNYLIKTDGDRKRVNDNIAGLQNVVHNCTMLIQKHLKQFESKTISEVLNYKLDFTLANMLIQKYLEKPYPMIVDEKTKMTMIKMLQVELNVQEEDLDKLLEMAYKEYKEAINVKADDKIILGRKNKNA